MHRNDVLFARTALFFKRRKSSNVQDERVVFAGAIAEMHRNGVLVALAQPHLAQKQKKQATPAFFVCHSSLFRTSNTNIVEIFLCGGDGVIVGFQLFVELFQIGRHQP